MPIISENSTSATSALITAFFRMKAGPEARAAGEWVGWDALTPRSLHFFNFRPAEQTGRKENQDHDQDRERGDVFVLDRAIGRPHRLDQPDRKPSEHGAGQ